MLMEGELSFGVIINKFDLAGLSVSLLARTHILTLLILEVSELFNCFNEGDVTKRQVSSANNRGVESMLLDRTLIYSKNRSGPKVDPWARGGVLEDVLGFEDVLQDTF